tara:strand:- start:291 stop:1127 length:837 start_codon:yes stop_codon:yes gene_type:complete
MIHEAGNQILDKLERSLGRMVLPQLIRWLAGFQAMTWALSLFSPEFVTWITFDREAILSGQVWRLISWTLFPLIEPGSTSIISVLFVFIMVRFMFFIGDSLEGEWGSFRLNTYVFGTVACLDIVGMIPATSGAGPLMSTILFSVIFLAFASAFPNQIINLFAIIPIKAKWLGWADAAFLASIFFLSPAPLLAAIVVFSGLLPYALTFFPSFFSEFKQNSEAAVRQHRFQEAGTPQHEAFHTCESCGANDKTNPDLEFRVTSNGDEMCDECLNSRSSAK